MKTGEWITKWQKHVPRRKRLGQILKKFSDKALIDLCTKEMNDGGRSEGPSLRVNSLTRLEVSSSECEHKI